MIPFLNAMSIAAGADGPPLKTYAEFAAHIDAEVSVTVQWASSALGGTSGAIKTTAGNLLSSGMAGSSWGQQVRGNGSMPARIVQHALQSEAVFLEQIASERLIALDVAVATFTTPYPGLDRNGYLSNPQGGGASPRTVTRCRFYVDGLGPMVSYPWAMIEAAPYTWTP